MWLYLSDSFLSIVKPSGNSQPGVLLVRARVKGDIERVFPGAEVLETPMRDYLYRALLPTSRVQEAMTYQIRSIGGNNGYDNFKNSVQDVHRHDVYTRVWSVTRALQYKEDHD